MDFPPLSSDPDRNLAANDSTAKDKKKMRGKNRQQRHQNQQPHQQQQPQAQKTATPQYHVLKKTSPSPVSPRQEHQSSPRENQSDGSNLMQDVPMNKNMLELSEASLAFECITAGSPLFECHLCSKTFPPSEADRHIGFDSNHIENKKRLKESLYFLQLENPPQTAIERLEGFLIETSTKTQVNSLLEEAVDHFLVLVNEAIESKVNPKASVRLFGSWLSGLALSHTSDVNLDLLYGQKGVRLRHTSTSEDDKLMEDLSEENGGEDNPAQILSKVAAILTEIEFPKKLGVSIINVKYEFEKSIPSVNFELTRSTSNLKPNSVNVEILLCGQRAYETSMLIKKYVQLDERFLVLARCLRMWVATCSLDDQDAGTWPPHAFTIMLIHFLQRRNPPVLPYLQEAGKETNESLRDKLYDHENQEFESTPDKSLDGIMNVEWKSKNTESIGVLWLEFFRYFALIFKAGKEVLSIRKPNSSAILTHKDKGWTSKIMAIEEPFRTWLNLSRTVGKREIYDVFMHILRESFAYFVVPHNGNSPIYGLQNYSMIRVHPELNATLGNLSLNDDSTDQIEESDEESGDDEDVSDSEKERYKDSSARFREAKLLAAKFGLRLAPDEKVTSAEELDHSKSVYTFSFGKFPWYKNPSKFCHLCRKSGHSGKGCPKANLPKLEPLPEVIPREKFAFYDRIFERIYERNKITTEITQRHESIANELQTLIRQTHPTALITLFGSSVNGFGSDNCDVDLCMTFEGNATGEDVDPKAIIEQLASILRKCPNVVHNSVLPIVHAKVPICKFQYVSNSHGRYKPLVTECDISLYNILALFNTGMLRAYTAIDPRVSMLGTVVKHFAKVCDIGDASRGSLSSYAYTLMTLHYLQQVKVIPCLQELHDGKKPVNRVDRWNTWFFQPKDMNHLDQIWPHRSTNDDSLGQLFLGFLRYYAEYFKFEEYVVCCRKLEKLSRLEKMWTGKKISIEDPFLLKHNLGQGLDNRMATYIKSCIILGRNHFGKAIERGDFQHLHEDDATRLLFNRTKITDGPLPSGRGCRICHKVAHKLRDCPSLKQRRQRNPMICNNCNKPGHGVRNCPEPRMNRPPHHMMNNQKVQQRRNQNGPVNRPLGRANQGQGQAVHNNSVAYRDGHFPAPPQDHGYARQRGPPRAQQELPHNIQFPGHQINFTQHNHNFPSPSPQNDASVPSNGRLFGRLGQQ